MNSQIRIIALALHISTLVYGGVIFILAQSNRWVSSWSLTPGMQILLYILLGSALICGGISILWPRLLKAERPTSPGAAIEPTPLFYDFSQTTPAIQTATIVRMALAEAVAIFGMVLSLITQSPTWIIPFGAAGLLLQILVGPFGRTLRGN